MQAVLSHCHEWMWELVRGGGGWCPAIPTQATKVWAQINCLTLRRPAHPFRNSPFFSGFPNWNNHPASLQQVKLSSGPQEQPHREMAVTVQETQDLAPQPVQTSCNFTPVLMLTFQSKLYSSLPSQQSHPAQQQTQRVWQFLQIDAKASETSRCPEGWVKQLDPEPTHV